MIRLLTLGLALVLTATAARAEDFSGFYAGVNAGYGWDRETTRGTGTAAPQTVPAGGNDARTALPPSAAAAATSLNRSGRGTATR